MKFEEYQHNAWGRRVTRDYPKMPRSMKLLFVVNHYVTKSCMWFSWILLGLSLAYMVNIVSSTWLAGGNKLISDSPSLIPMVGLVVAAVAVRWIIPVISNFVFNNWYYAARPSF